MSSTLTFSAHHPHFSEKIENFFRTSENFYKHGSGNGFASKFSLFPRDKYELVVDVSNYEPNEVSVSTEGDLLIVNAKHEETDSERGYTSKEFTNKYTLPSNVDKGKMTCVFKPNRCLMIEAPLVIEDEPNTRRIPIKILDGTVNGTSKTASNSSVGTTTNSSSVSHV